jgi:hypothetical protein
MRLLGQIAHPTLLISVFKSAGKIILKFEIGPFEQTYKFLETEKLYDSTTAEKIVDEELLAKVFKIFDQMNTEYQQLCKKI